MPRMAPITDDSCRTERMRATTSLSRSVTPAPAPTSARTASTSFARAASSHAPLAHDLGHRVGRERVELGGDPRPRLGDLCDRRGVEHAVGQRREQRDLVDETKRGEARLGEQRADALAARDRRLDPRCR